MICALCPRKANISQKTDNLVQEASKTGLQINLEKTETMTLFKKQQKPITIGVSELKEVTACLHLSGQGYINKGWF